MANKNTSRRMRELKANGGLTKYVHKKKAKPFPQPKDAGISLTDQREMLGWSR
jgi:hypothetical protein